MTLFEKQRHQPEPTAAEPTAEEAAWIAQARAGSEGAWRQLVGAHQTAVFRLAYLILGDAADAEDVAQEAFVRAYLGLDRFDETRPFRPWLLQITRNLARNRRRSLGRRWANLKRWWEKQPPKTVAGPPDIPGEARLLWQAVQTLPPKAQEVIYLRFFLELSEAETAVALNIPAGTVKSRLSRALAQLRGVVERDFPELNE